MYSYNPNFMNQSSWTGNRQSDLQFELANIAIGYQIDSNYYQTIGSNQCLPPKSMYMAAQESACCPKYPYFPVKSAEELAREQQINMMKKQCCELKNSFSNPYSYDYYLASQQFRF